MQRVQGCGGAAVWWCRGAAVVRYHRADRGDCVYAVDDAEGLPVPIVIGGRASKTARYTDADAADTACPRCNAAAALPRAARRRRWSSGWSGLLARRDRCDRRRRFADRARCERVVGTFWPRGHPQRYRLLCCCCKRVGAILRGGAEWVIRRFLVC